MKRIIFCLFLILNAFPALAQQIGNEWLSELKHFLQEYSSRQPEKIYLHTDRAVYASADTVWFKAYLVDAKSHMLHPIPEILYLDLVSEKNEVIISQRLQAENGFKAGSLILPDTLKTGNYLVRVYTNWQRNAGPATFFRKALFVNKVPLKETVAISEAKALQEVLFFPEGGNLVPGFESKVGFKAVFEKGAIMPIEGKILDEAGKLITTFRSNAAGYGSFTLKPQAGKTYLAQVSGASGRKEFALPLATKQYGLRVKNSSDSVSILLANAENNAAPAYLVLQSNGNVVITDSVKFNANGLRKRTFSSKDWPEGIMQVTLFSAQNPVSERLFFHSKANPLSVKLETAKKAYSRREPVQVNVLLKDAAGNPIETELSVAVSNDLPDKTPSLRNSVLFASQIQEIDPVVLKDPDMLDNLLLTQTLSGFSWHALTNVNDQPPAFARETVLNRVGKVMENGNAVGRAVIYLLETISGETHLVTSDAEGQFKLPLTGSRFFYQIWQNGVLRHGARLQLTNLENGALVENWTEIPATDSLKTRQFKLRRQIDMTYAQETEGPKVNFVNTNMWPAYAADKYYPLVEYNELATMEEILREMVPEVRVITRKKQVQANMYDADRRIFFPYQPLYIIDGQPTWNHDLFLRLDASQLEQVNIYNSAKTLKNFGFLGNQGVIVVFTKSRNYQNPELASENILTIPGQQTIVQYKPSDKPINVPDFRPTLYWNPKVQTNAEGKAIINFRTTDEMGNLKVQVQGITKEGQLISEELLIPVRNAE